VQALGAVFGEGRKASRLMLVGEQPGDREDRMGKPFVGPASRELDRGLAAAGFAAAERWVVHLHFRRSTHSLSLGELPLVCGLMFLPAHELVFAGLVGSSLALAFDREIPLFKAFFNLAQFTLGTCVALFIVEGLTAMRDPLDPIVWIAVFAAVSAATLVASAIGRITAIRFMKNSSRFDEKIARNLTRSNRGFRSSSASLSTLRLNSSQLRSRSSHACRVSSAVVRSACSGPRSVSVSITDLARTLQA
jgi:hypothetical protein